MRFFKEIFVLSFIIIFLIVSEICISNFTKKSIEEIDGKIDDIIKSALNSETYIKEEQLKKIESFENDWKKLEDKLAYFAEHDELEKVSASIVMMKANIEMDSREDAYEKMQEIKFRIEHIKTKQQLRLNNVF